MRYPGYHMLLLSLLGFVITVLPPCQPSNSTTPAPVTTPTKL